MEASSRKHCREDSPESDRFDPETKRLRLVSEAVACCTDVDVNEFSLPELLLLGMLDEPVETEEVGKDLDSVIRSFEEEITAPASEAQPELGFLLEASDNELGLLPPPASEEDKAEVVDADVNFADVLGFEDGLKSYDLLEFEFGDLLDDGGAVVEGGFDDGLFGNELVVQESGFFAPAGKLAGVVEAGSSFRQGGFV